MTGCCKPYAASGTDCPKSEYPLQRGCRRTRHPPTRVPPGACRRVINPVLALELGLIATTLVAAAGLWLLGASASLALLLPVLLYLGRHMFRLLQISRLIRLHHRLVPPFPGGVWGEIYRTIAQYQQRGRRSRRRQVRFTRRFREAAESVPDALVVLDKGKRIEWANPAAEVLMNLHWRRDDGRPFTDVFSYPGLAEYIDAGEYTRPLDVAPEHDRSIMLSIRVAPFGERRRQRLIVGRDITKIYHLNMIRRDFVANVSHELRTPLTVIAGFVENLAESPLTPEHHRRPLKLMQNQAERMRCIIEDLLTLSRLEMDEQTSRAEPVDVPDEIHLTIADARALSENRHGFSHSIDETLFLLGNEAELHSAFSNLIFNAVKHTPPGSHIHIGWGMEERGACFTVRDDGPGIDQQHIPRLTERFYRIDKARSRASGGTGLGLAIVKHVLNRHGARLTVASEPGKGSVFTCCFPASNSLRQSPRTDLLPAGSESGDVL